MDSINLLDYADPKPPPQPPAEAFLMDELKGAENWTAEQILANTQKLCLLRKFNPELLELLTARWHAFDTMPRGALEKLMDNVAPPSPPEPNPAPQAKRQALDVHRWNQFRGLPLPLVQWIWEPFFPRVPFGILASHSGHGKSWLSLQLGVAVATGLPLFDTPTCGPAGAGVLALEDDLTVIHRRIQIIKEDYGMAWTPEHDDLLDKNLVVMTRSRGAIEGKGEAAEAHQLHQLTGELKAAMQTTQAPAAVLFVDTLNAVHEGDENSNTEVRPLVAAIFGLHDALNCSVWALHHLRKAGSGRNAPAMTDRMDPELARGASALVASARAMVQFGWITSTEAGKAGLYTEGAHRRYAILGLTKINDGPQSKWMLLEHSQQGGLWVPTPEGDRALALLKGGDAAKVLKKAEQLLLDIHSGVGKVDRSELVKKHYPDDEHGERKLKDALKDLRTRQKWLVPRQMDLTDLGLKKVRELKGGQGSGFCPPGDLNWDEKPAGD